MDRLIVLEAGRIVEQGTHAELLRLGGLYERLWRHQSGGFLAPDVVATETATGPPDEPPAEEMRLQAKPEPSTEDAPVATRA
jgi:ATP-binding cassette subfamily B multidrug efflux pump